MFRSVDLLQLLQNLASATQLKCLTPLKFLTESRLLSFVTAEEDLRIETSCPLNEATAVSMLKNLCYHHTSHSDEPLSYQYNYGIGLTQPPNPPNAIIRAIRQIFFPPKFPAIR